MNSQGVEIATWGTPRNWILAILLGLATIHCVQSIFLVNVSYIDLQSYDKGTEKMPFQGRIAMMPVGRWAARSHMMQTAVRWMKVRIVQGRMIPAEPYTAEKIAFLCVGLIVTLLTTGFVAKMGWSLVPGFWWLPPALFLYMLYVTYAARCDATFWYPYDLTHFALFGIAAVCVLRGYWIPAFCLFLADLPVRETSIYLVPLMIAVGYSRKQLTRAVLWSGVMVLLWAVVRVSISHHFSGNPSDTRPHFEFWYYAVHNPYKWAQFATPFGFLVIPFFWGWKYLTREEKFFVYGAIPGLFLTAVFGVPIETRIYDEWLAPIAILLSLQATRYLSTIMESFPYRPEVR